MENKRKKRKHGYRRPRLPTIEENPPPVMSPVERLDSEPASHPQNTSIDSRHIGPDNSGTQDSNDHDNHRFEIEEAASRGLELRRHREPIPSQQINSMVSETQVGNDNHRSETEEAAGSVPELDTSKNKRVDAVAKDINDKSGSKDGAGPLKGRTQRFYSSISSAFSQSKKKIQHQLSHHSSFPYLRSQKEHPFKSSAPALLSSGASPSTPATAFLQAYYSARISAARIAADRIATDCIAPVGITSAGTSAPFAASPTAFGTSVASSATPFSVEPSSIRAAASNSQGSGSSSSATSWANTSVTSDSSEVLRNTTPSSCTDSFPAPISLLPPFTRRSSSRYPTDPNDSPDELEDDLPLSSDPCDVQIHARPQSFSHVEIVVDPNISSAFDLAGAPTFLQVSEDSSHLESDHDTSQTQSNSPSVANLDNNPPFINPDSGSEYSPSVQSSDSLELPRSSRARPRCERPVPVKTHPPTESGSDCDLFTQASDSPTLSRSPPADRLSSQPDHVESSAYLTELIAGIEDLTITATQSTFDKEKPQLSLPRGSSIEDQTPDDPNNPTNPTAKQEQSCGSTSISSIGSPLLELSHPPSEGTVISKQSRQSPAPASPVEDYPPDLPYNSTNLAANSEQSQSTPSFSSVEDHPSDHPNIMVKDRAQLHREHFERHIRRRPGETTPSTVSSAEPPSPSPSSTSESNVDLTQHSTAVDPTQSSSVPGTPSTAPASDSAAGVNLTPPSRGGRRGFPTVPEPLPREPTVPLVTPAPPSEPPFDPFAAFLDTPLPPSVMLDEGAHREVGLPVTNPEPSIDPMGEYMPDEFANILYSEQQVLQNMAGDSSSSMQMTGEEEELMEPISENDIDTLFDQGPEAEAKARETAENPKQRILEMDPRNTTQGPASTNRDAALATLATLAAFRNALAAVSTPAAPPNPPTATSAKRQHRAATASPNAGSSSRTRSTAALSLSASASPAVPVSTRRLRSSDLALPASGYPVDIPEPESRVEEEEEEGKGKGKGKGKKKKGKKGKGKARK